MPQVTSMSEETVYSKRIVAFLDILGFEDHIERTADPDYARKILRVLRSIFRVKQENDSDPIPLKEIGIEVTVFSDSVVISYSADDENALFGVILDITHLQLNLMAHGVLMRGGISVGDLYHDG